MSLAIIIGLISFFILAVVNVMDKFVLEKKVSPATFVFYSTIFLLPTALLLFWRVGFFDNYFSWLIAVLSAVGFCLSLWTMYIGLEDSEASHFIPFIGAILPVFLLIFDYLFLGENFTVKELLAIVILVIGSFVIAIGAINKKFFLLGTVTGFFSAISLIGAKYLYEIYDFFTVLVWTRGIFLGIFGVLLLLYPIVRKEAFGKKRERTKAKNLIVVMTDKILGVIGIVLFQYAIALGNVTIIGALAGIQYAILIILIFILSKFLPKLFQEHYLHLELSRELMAVFLIGLGLAVLVW